MCSRLRHGIGPGHDRRGWFHLRGEAGQEDCVDCCACVTARQGAEGPLNDIVPLQFPTVLGSKQRSVGRPVASSLFILIRARHPCTSWEGAVWSRWTPTFHDSSLLFPSRRVFNIYIHHYRDIDPFPRGDARALTFASTQPITSRGQTRTQGTTTPRSHSPSRPRSNSTNLNLRWSQSTAPRAPRPSPRSRSDSLVLGVHGYSISPSQ